MTTTTTTTMKGAALLVLAVVGLSEGCRPAPCPNGCFPENEPKDDTQTNSVRCKGPFDSHDIAIPPVHSCHVNVQDAVITTRHVCLPWWSTGSGQRVFCLAAGTCTLTRKMDTSHFVCPDCDCTKTGCASGYACDTLTKKCTAVSCSAVGACPAGSKCVADDLIRCVRAPCPGFRCEGPLREGDVCYSFCEDSSRCPSVNRRDDCPAGTECVSDLRIGFNSRATCQKPEPFNCLTRERWTEEKRTWCCANKGVGCPAPGVCAQDSDCQADEQCKRGLGTDGQCEGERRCVKKSEVGGRCGGSAWFPFDCIVTECKDGLVCTPPSPDLMDAPSTCQKPCTSNADCDADHECKAAFVKESCGGARTCKKRAGRGQRCGGFTPFDCLVQSCQPGLKCTWPAGLTDAPGTCQ